MSTSPHAPTKRHSWWVAFVCGMASYIDAVSIVSTGVALTIYTQVFSLSPEKLGGLASTLTFFIAIGALLGGRLGDRFGRKTVFMCTMVVILVGALCAVVGTNFTTMAVGIGLVGLGTGADLPVSLATIAEEVKQSARGELISFSQILWTLGIILSGLSGTAFGNLGRLGGQLMFAHIGVAALLVLALRFTIPESQEWRDARESQAATGAPQAKEGLLDLLRPPYAKPFIALVVFYGLTNVSVNTNGQFGTYILHNLGGLSIATASAIFTSCSVFGIVLTFLFMKCVDTKYRMPLFYVGAATGIVSWLVPAILGSSAAPLIAQLYLIIIFNGLAFEAMMKVWTQETFPTLLRTTAQGTIIAVARFLAAGAVAVTPALLAWSPLGTYLSQTVLMIVGLTAAIAVFRRGTYESEAPAETSKEATLATSAV